MNNRKRSFDDLEDLFGGGDKRKSYARSFSFDKDAVKSSASQAGDLLKDAARVLIDAVDTVVQSQKSKMPNQTVDRYRDEAYKVLMKKLERSERALENKKKSVVTLGIIAFVFLFIEPFPVSVIMSAIAAYQFYGVYEIKERIQRLLHDREEFMDAGLPSHRTSVEKIILRHAYENDGRVYPERLAVESDLSLAEAEKVLAICVDKRISSIELDANGRTYYYFASFDNFDPYKNL